MLPALSLLVDCPLLLAPTAVVAAALPVLLDSSVAGKSSEKETLSLRVGLTAVFAISAGLLSRTVFLKIP